MNPSTFTLEAVPRTATDIHGNTRDNTAPTLTFTTAMSALHWMVQHNVVATSHLGARADEASLGDARDTHAHWRYVQNHDGRYRVTPDQMLLLRAARDRLRHLTRYLRETEPLWQTVRETHWADNSVTADQVAHDGRTRTITLTAPHGDTC